MAVTFSISHHKLRGDVIDILVDGKFKASLQPGDERSVKLISGYFSEARRGQDRDGMPVWEFFFQGGERDS